MGIDLVDYEAKAREAVRAFWGNREAALKKQIESGKADQGGRGAATSGKNMDGFLALAQDVVRSNGLSQAQIHVNRRLLTLPGFYRPTKLWDMLVIHQGRLVAALEFKSQVGPSFRNNFNNRAEEALGTAVDLWKAFRENAFGDQPPPFVGWLMLVEDCERSQTPIRDSSPPFPVLDDFKSASYAQRYGILCRKTGPRRIVFSRSLIAVFAKRRRNRQLFRTGRNYRSQNVRRLIGCSRGSRSGHIQLTLAPIDLVLTTRTRSQRPAVLV